MTESEAIKHAREYIKYLNHSGWEKDFDAIEKLIVATEEIQQYREIGTVEEIRRLKAKYTPKAAVITGHNNAINTDIGECPNCRTLPLRACDFKYCPECGQRLDWSK